MLLMVMSTFFLSLGGFFAKYYIESVSIIALLFARLMLPGFMFGLVSKSYYKDKVALSDFLLISRRSVFIALTQILFFYSLVGSSILEVAVLFSTAPLYLPIIERLFGGGKVGFRIIFCILISFFGVVVYNGFDFDNLSIYTLSAIFAAFTNAVSQYFMFKSSKLGVSVYAQNSISFVIAFIIIFLFYIFSLDVKIDVQNNDYFLPIIIISCAAFFTQTFRSYAYKTSKNVSRLAPLLYLNVVFSYFFDVLFMGTTFTFMQVTGLSLVVLGAFLTIFINKK